ncbi:MAG: hypothetical protein CL941_05230 [Desulfobacter sp.]|nr:hypothetical protein [Desulfobacter sp.]
MSYRQPRFFQKPNLSIFSLDIQKKNIYFLTTGFFRVKSYSHLSKSYENRPEPAERLTDKAVKIAFISFTII